jgi:flagellar hook-basal body complex protein FliE
MELELDKVRSYRDTMAGGVLEWQEASMLVQAATELLDRAVTCWKEINSQ